MARAVSVNINSRQDESDGQGVMCPSYRVTHNLDLSPGGLKRLVWQVINGNEVRCQTAEIGLRL